MSLLISVFYVSVCVCGPGASVCLDTDDIMWSLFCDWLMFVYELADIQRVTELLLMMIKMKVWVLLLVLSSVPCVSAYGESLNHSLTLF